MQEPVQCCIEILEDHEWKHVWHINQGPCCIVHRGDPFIRVSLCEDELHIGIVGISLEYIGSDVTGNLDKTLGDAW